LILIVTESSVTKECRKCKFQVDPQHMGECPNCHENAGYHVNVGIVEHVTITDRISVKKLSRKEQIQRNPKPMYFAIILFVITSIVSLIDSQFTFVIQIIIGVNAVGQTPINVKRIIEREETFS